MRTGTLGLPVRHWANIVAGHRVVTKLWPPRQIKMLIGKGCRPRESSPEKAQFTQAGELIGLGTKLGTTACFLQQLTGA